MGDYYVRVLPLYLPEFIQISDFIAFIAKIKPSDSLLKEVFLNSNNEGLNKTKAEPQSQQVNSDSKGGGKKELKSAYAYLSLPMT